MRNSGIVIVAIAVIAVAAAVVSSSVIISSEKNSDGDRYGIICAMSEEVEELLNSLDETDCQKIGDTQFHVGKLCGKNVVVSECGIGKVNAAMCAQTMITHFKAKWIINSGIAGTISPEVGIGNIVISTETVQHDYDYTEMGYAPGEVPNVGTVAIKADDKLRETAANAISKTTLGTKVFQGRICTGDQFIAGGDEMKKITDVFGGLCCEMEGGAIAQVSYLNKVPFVIIRAISDDVDGGGPEDFIKFEKEMSALCAKMTMEMLKEL